MRLSFFVIALSIALGVLAHPIAEAGQGVKVREAVYRLPLALKGVASNSGRLQAVIKKIIQLPSFPSLRAVVPRILRQIRKMAHNPNKKLGI